MRSRSSASIFAEKEKLKKPSCILVLCFLFLCILLGGKYFRFRPEIASVLDRKNFPVRNCLMLLMFSPEGSLEVNNVEVGSSLPPPLNFDQAGGL